MNKLKKYWMVVLLGGLLMATLVGVAAARPNDRSAGAISRRITIPAAHFIPNDEDVQFHNSGFVIYSDTDTDEYFVAPVVFPTGQSVVVESMTFYAYDNNASADMCVYTYLTDPTAGGEAEIAQACSSGASPTDPRAFTDSGILNNPVKHGKGVYLWLELHDDTNLKFYGARIQYHHGTT